MLALNSHITKTQFAIVFVWLSLTIAAFAYFINDRLVSFNFDDKLNGIEHQQLAIALKPYAAAFADNKANTVLHFSQPNCKCQQYSKGHIEDINKIAEEYKFNVANITLTEHLIVPATPSIAILNNLGKVIYFGPYGEGLACSQTSGYAQTILNNFIKGYAANFIIKDAKGCYCKV